MSEPRMKVQYNTEIAPSLMKKFGYKSVMAIYRIDRIKEYCITDTHFRVPYEKRFEEGEFRKRIQFMYSGKLQKVKFYYKGKSIEAVLDRLPTAKILGIDDKGYLVTAEVFGDGLDIWLRSHGDAVEVVSRV